MATVSLPEKTLAPRSTSCWCDVIDSRAGWVAGAKERSN